VGAGAGVRGVASVELWEEKPTRYPARETGGSPYDVARFTGRMPQTLCYSPRRRL